MNLFFTIVAGFVVSAVAAFSSTSVIFNKLTSNISKSNAVVKEKLVEQSTPEVLGESTEKDSVTFNVDAIFNKALII